MVDQVLSFLISLVATAILLEPFKRFQRKHKIGQYIRQEGPDLHNYKTGTPTASGVIFIPISLIVMILFFRKPETLIVVLAGILFGAVGLIDDISKIAKKNAAGLSGKRKLLLQFVFASIVVLMIQLYNPHTSMKIPFGGEIEFGFLYYIISAIVLAGMSNA
ncbi:MAG TPA: phospho-N-acetylmuramoyl-pentapeptide-transferase, partial [Mesotoga infera]|nr:phospho-N-acetylmuramoyl-pentapeptide-transferase [Mesotoga infera]